MFEIRINANDGGENSTQNEKINKYIEELYKNVNISEMDNKTQILMRIIDNSEMRFGINVGHVSNKYNLL